MSKLSNFDGKSVICHQFSKKKTVDFRCNDCSIKAQKLLFSCFTAAKRNFSFSTYYNHYKMARYFREQKSLKARLMPRLSYLKAARRIHYSIFRAENQPVCKGTAFKIKASKRRKNGNAVLKSV